MAMVTEYDFSKHHTLLDLGGGIGLTTGAILKIHDREIKKHSNLSMVYVFDLEQIVKNGVVKHPLVEYRAGSFFISSNIPTGADCILINNVIHEWNDEESLNILRNAVSVLEKGGVIIVSDVVAYERSDPLFNAFARFDVFAMVVSKGRFRTYSEYNALWCRANLTVVEMRPTRSLNTIFILAAISVDDVKPISKADYFIL